MPHPIPELGGRMGLYSYEIADSLGVRHGTVVAKAKTKIAKFASQGWDISPSAEISARRPGVGGRPIKPLAFCLDAAKAFVAKWDNEIGMAYLKHLLTCEQVVERMIEKVAMAPSSKLDDAISLLSRILARQEDRFIEQEARISAIAADVAKASAALTVEAIDIRITETIKARNIGLSHSDITLPDIVKDYSLGMSPVRVGEMLDAIGHPRNEIMICDHAGQMHATFCFKRDGIDEAIETLFESVRFVKSSELNHIFTSRYLTKAKVFMIRKDVMRGAVRKFWLSKLKSPMNEVVSINGWLTKKKELSK